MLLLSSCAVGEAVKFKKSSKGAASKATQAQYTPQYAAKDISTVNKAHQLWLGMWYNAGGKNSFSGKSWDKLTTAQKTDAYKSFCTFLTSNQALYNSLDAAEVVALRKFCKSEQKLDSYLALKTLNSGYKKAGFADMTDAQLEQAFVVMYMGHLRDQGIGFILGKDPGFGTCFSNPKKAPLGTDPSLILGGNSVDPKAPFVGGVPSEQNLANFNPGCASVGGMPGRTDLPPGGKSLAGVCNSVKKNTLKLSTLAKTIAPPTEGKGESKPIGKESPTGQLINPDKMEGTVHYGSSPPGGFDDTSSGFLPPICTAAGEKGPSVAAGAWGAVNFGQERWNDDASSIMQESLEAAGFSSQEAKEGATAAENAIDSAEVEGAEKASMTTHDGKTKEISTKGFSGAQAQEQVMKEAAKEGAKAAGASPNQAEKIANNVVDKIKQNEAAVAKEEAASGDEKEKEGGTPDTAEAKGTSPFCQKLLEGAVEDGCGPLTPSGKSAMDQFIDNSIDSKAGGSITDPAWDSGVEPCIAVDGKQPIIMGACPEVLPTADDNGCGVKQQPTEQGCKKPGEPSGPPAMQKKEGFTDPLPQ